jgi:hypothetical protein
VNFTSFRGKLRWSSKTGNPQRDVELEVPAADDAAFFLDRIGMIRAGLAVGWHTSNSSARIGKTTGPIVLGRKAAEMFSLCPHPSSSNHSCSLEK